MIFKPANRKYFTVKFQQDGKTIQKRTKATSRKDARVIEAELRSELARGHFGILKARPIPTVGEFLKSDFLPFAAGLKPGTATNYRYAAQRLLNSPISGLRLDQVNSQETANFAAHAKFCPVTINMSLRVLRRALRLAVEWDRLPIAPKIPLVQGERQRERVLSADEFASYFQACCPLWQDVVTLLYGTGCRPGEVYALRWENIMLNGEGGLIHIAAGKTRAARRVLPMLPEVYTVLHNRRHAQGNPSEGWVFPRDGKYGHLVQQNGIRYHTTALRRSGVKAFPVYTLRHSALTRLAESGCDAFTLARIAGHSSITITQKYCHPGAEAMDRAFAKLTGVVTDAGYQLLGEVAQAR